MVPFAPAIQAYAAEKTVYSRQDLVDAANGILNWCSTAAGGTTSEDLTGGLLAKNAGTTDSDWFVIAMSQMGLPGDYAGYLSALAKNVQARYNSPDRLSASKATEWHRISLAVLACGGDPRNTGGADLIADGTYDRGLTKPLDTQGNNGTIFALIALDSKNYTAPAGAYEGREAILQKILDVQLSGGGFAQLGTSGDVDVTAMALMALAPYREVCGTQIDKAVSFLSAQQSANGGFSSRGVENTESAAQVIMALTALGIDPQKDSRFDKNGNTPVSRLMSMALPSGGIRHTESGTEDWMASQQALCAISALVRQMDGKGSLYRFGGGTPALKQPGPDAISGAADPVGEGEQPLEVDGTAAENISDLPATDGDASEFPAEDIPEQAHAEDLEDLTSEGIAPKQSGFARTGGILLALLGSGLCFWIGLKKSTGRKKDLWLLLAALLAAASLYLLANPQSFEQFRAGQLSGETGDTVTVRIDCSTVWDNEEDLDPALIEGDYIPADGIFLTETSVPFTDGETAFDVLMRVAAMENLQVDYQGADSTLYGTAYIRGIQHLYEFSCGPLSGWTYSVNGEFPDRGSSGYPLAPGDRVEWIYTCDLGRYTDITEAGETP
ncbi:MAG: DUF4430 domain-containing protein [Eubacteriales bacterium]|nr:DUF4430 domain-containing protein [Eubacteriales bacterium]